MCRHDVFTLQVSEDIHYSSCINIRNLGLCWSNCNMNTSLSHVLSACREHVWLVCLSELSHVLSACREHVWLVCLSELAHVLSACREHVWLVCLSELARVLSACREHVWLVCLSELAHVHISHCRFQKLYKILANSCVNFRNYNAIQTPVCERACMCSACYKMMQTVVQHWRHHTHKPMTVGWCKTMCS